MHLHRMRASSHERQITDALAAYAAGLVIALINSFNLFWIACTWARVDEMLWPSVDTAGFRAVPSIESIN